MGIIIVIYSLLGYGCCFCCILRFAVDLCIGHAVLMKLNMTEHAEMHTEQKLQKLL